ncbi:MAG: SDR family NAD(P)-dependent oxidoreductase [Candidatus Bathyarchaeia archaeon]
MTTLQGRFVGKTVIITNAAGSVGIAAARLFHSEGANVIANDERISALQILEHGLDSRFKATFFDLSRPEAGFQLAQETLGRFGSIDILVCNEGTSHGKILMDVTVQEWDMVIEKNLTAIFHVLQGVYNHFREKGSGTVILVSSIVGRSGCGDMVDYASSMGGVLGMMKTISREWSRWGVTCSAVCPGPIEEGDQGLNVKSRSRFSQTQVELANRNVTAEQVARVILFLASEDGKPINGQAVNVDYGLYLHTL